jgi:hypothetical protein
MHWLPGCWALRPEEHWVETIHQAPDLPDHTLQGVIRQRMAHVELRLAAGNAPTLRTEEDEDA